VLIGVSYQFVMMLMLCVNVFRDYISKIQEKLSPVILRISGHLLTTGRVGIGFPSRMSNGGSFFKFIFLNCE
jgi:hypothetical protein